MSQLERVQERSIPINRAHTHPLTMFGGCPWWVFIPNLMLTGFLFAGLKMHLVAVCVGGGIHLLFCLLNRRSPYLVRILIRNSARALSSNTITTLHS
jgi:type IV secretory pathway TrbD component